MADAMLWQRRNSMRRKTRSMSEELRGEGNSFLQKKDAFSTGVGVLIGLFLFATNKSDFFFGGSLFVLLLLSLSTPEVLDMETQFSAYLAYHSNTLNHLIHVLTIWPQFLSALILVASASSWAPLVAGYYGLYFVVADRSFTGVMASFLVLACYMFATRFAQDDAARPALLLNLLCWCLQTLGSVVLEKRVWGYPLILRENFIQQLLMSPLLVTIDIAVALGFRKDFARRTRSNVSSFLEEHRIRSDSESCGS